MSDEQPTSLPPRAQRDMPVHCVKCGAFNERDAQVCSACGDPLRFKCRHCQASNLRTTSRCSHCHQLLRLGDWDLRLWPVKFKSWRWHRAWFKRRFEHWSQFAALLVIIGVLIWMLTSMFWVSGPRR